KLFCKIKAEGSGKPGILAHADEFSIYVKINFIAQSRAKIQGKVSFLKD
ncbi:unnamed protein product, partial [marine sediment metagenome]